MPSELAIGPASRRWGAGPSRASRFWASTSKAEIVGFVSEHVEGRLKPGPGLYRCTEDDANGPQPVRSLEGSGPVLLFLHGTASSTSGSFSGLWHPQAGSLIKPLFSAYGGRVLAYQHRTLTESPIENARFLADALNTVLGPKAELHIVSHSRGGLIGELLARSMRKGAAPITADDLALFEGRAEDRAALAKLALLLETSQPAMTKFVRVGVPGPGHDARGSSSGSICLGPRELRIDDSRTQGESSDDGLTSLLAGVLKKRTDPENSPGIEAMMPTSPLVRMLNRPDVTTAADLHVLGGDLAGVGMFGRLKTLVTDFYYRDDHDLVVNTPAMLGGIERTMPVRYWIDTGDQVTHFHYFARQDTARKLVSALTGSDAEFRTLQTRPSAVTSADYVKRASMPQPVVFVLPGSWGRS